MTAAVPAGNTTLLDLTLELQQMKLDYDTALDTIWLVLAGLLVFFMHAGFSLLESGSVRFKNAQNILVKNLIVVTTGFLCWWAMGYALAFGVTDDPSRFIGSRGFFMDGMWEEKSLLKKFFFQGAFCATSGTIVSGAMAERTQLKGFFIFIVGMTAFIYPTVAYWAWSGEGFLYYEKDGKAMTSWEGPPFLDFAGSGVVHMTGGFAALCGAIVVGPRQSRWEERFPDDFAPHNIPFCILGTLILWTGWYGFNPGSTGSMHTAEMANRAGLAVVNTTMAPCIAGLVVFVLRALVVEPKRLDAAGLCNGILAGLVAVTASCNLIRPWESIVIGLVAGIIYQASSMLIVRAKVDDVVDAFAVHGMNGLWGTIAVGLFGNEAHGAGGNGSLYGGDRDKSEYSRCQHHDGE
jgi:Amt family ammonium transporter